MHEWDGGPRGLSALPEDSSSFHIDHLSSFLDQD
jgi:hypothetical protein